jgi:hypothetical protein
MISGAQIRAARALLNISAAQLAETSGVDWSTIQRFESFNGISKSRGGTIGKVKRSLEELGIIFTGDPVNSPGVQLNRPFGGGDRNK